MLEMLHASPPSTDIVVVIVRIGIGTERDTLAQARTHWQGPRTHSALYLVRRLLCHLICPMLSVKIRGCRYSVNNCIGPRSLASQSCTVSA